jgi:transcriptional regulator with XRE-family HTH domain
MCTVLGMSSTRTALICVAANKTRAELAAFLGCSPSHVSRLRDGYPESGPVSRLLDMLAREIGRDDLTAAAFADSDRAAATLSTENSAGDSP